MVFKGRKRRRRVNRQSTRSSATDRLSASRLRVMYTFPIGTFGRSPPSLSFLSPGTDTPVGCRVVLSDRMTGWPGAGHCQLSLCVLLRTHWI